MALPDAVKGARKRTITITWTDDAEEAIPLTGATITGYIRRDGVATAISGVLALVTPASGIFSWAYSAADVAVAGSFDVVFIATYADTLTERTYITNWTVRESYGA